MFIVDPGRSLYYMVNTESFQGDRIVSERDFVKSYAIEIEEVHWMEENGECLKYGKDTKFPTYADCVANEYEKIFVPLFGCMVPWLVGPDHPGICQGTSSKSPEADEKMVEYARKFLVHEEYKTSETFSECPRQCAELRIRSELTSVKETWPGMVEIDIRFR